MDLFELEDTIPAFVVESGTFCGKERALETEEFTRVRVGIGRPVVGEIRGYVLERFPWGQRILIRRTVDKVAEEIEGRVRGDKDRG